ncbi:MAG: hypothetical protein K2P58_15635 [Hyphomonadaceae bacterium]|nr:hypothetical protein [Hyphomonadaceae bacterium]
MTTVRKFAFDTEFTPDGGVLSHAPPTFGQADVDAACAEAYARGARDSVAQSERDAADALQALADAASALLTRLDAESRAMRTEATQIAFASARKIAGEALEAFGVERAAAAIEATLDLLRHQPRLIVKLSPDAAEKLSPRIAAMTETHAYAGAILVRAQSDMKAGEVAIDWSDGAIAIDPDDAAARIDTLIQAALSAPEHS